MELFTSALSDAFFDSLKLIPFLFVAYLVIELLTYYAGNRTYDAVQKAGKAGPVIGALLGIIPQCGFSTFTAMLYAGRVVSMGTVLAVFLSTSDEMLPIFIAQQAPLGLMLEIIGIKLAVAIGIGFMVDLFMRRMIPADAAEIPADGEAGGSDEAGSADEGVAGGGYVGYNGEDLYADEEGQLFIVGTDEPYCNEDGEPLYVGACGTPGCDCQNQNPLITTIVHTVKTTVFIFLVSVLLNLIIGWVGEDALGQFMSSNTALSVVASCLVGLIPNCAASVAITELYLQGALGFGAMIGGLLVSSGVGLLVLFQTNRPLSDSIRVTAYLLAVGLLFGWLFSLAGF